MSPADLVLGAFQICGGALWLLLLGGIAWAIRDAVRHRLIHRRLDLPGGYQNTCPICLRDQEVTTVHWAARWSRDLKRKRLKREEFER